MSVLTVENGAPRWRNATSAAGGAFPATEALLGRVTGGRSCNAVSEPFATWVRELPGRWARMPSGGLEVPGGRWSGASGCAVAFADFASKVVAAGEQPCAEGETGSFAQYRVAVGGSGVFERDVGGGVAIRVVAQDDEGAVADFGCGVLIEGPDDSWDDVGYADLGGTAAFAREAVQRDLADRGDGVVERGEEHVGAVVCRVVIEEFETASAKPRIVMVKRDVLQRSDGDASREDLDSLRWVGVLEATQEVPDNGGGGLVHMARVRGRMRRYR